MVTRQRYRKMAFGGDPTKPTPELNNIRSDVKKFYTDYLNSPNYKNRLITMGYNNPSQVIQARSARINGEQFLVNKGDGSEYKPNGIQKSGKASIVYDPQEAAKYKISPSTVLAHEYSHRIGALGFDIPTKDQYINLNEKEVGEISKRNNVSNTWPEHDARPAEAKSDIDALRYRLYKDKIYNTGTQQFTPQTLKQAKQKYSSDGVMSRLFNHFSDNDLIYLMNNVATTNQQQPETTAAYGGRIVKPFS